MTSGLINPNNYKIVIRHPPMNIAPITISEALHSLFRVVDVELENWTSPNRRNTPIAYGGISIYVRCNSLAEALNIPGYVMLSGHKIKIWHAGLKRCEICNEKGHGTNEHEKIERRMKQVKKQRRAAKRRRLSRQ